MTRFPRTAIGSVISGTMRPEDLIPAFLHELRAVPEVAGNLDEIEARMAQDDYFLSEDAGYDLEELFDLLDEVAPEGCSFGAHPGDGADYGFWENENDENDEDEENDNDDDE